MVVLWDATGRRNGITSGTELTVTEVTVTGPTVTEPPSRSHRHEASGSDGSGGDGRLSCPWPIRCGVM